MPKSILSPLREQVLEANLELVRRGLVLYTFGNARGISRKEGVVVTKPSGVAYETLKPELMVVSDLEGNIIEGDLRPSSDLPMHLVLYKAFPNIGGVVHTHSEYATAWAQARREIPCFGTTHADYFHGPMPVTEPLTEQELEANTKKIRAKRSSVLSETAARDHCLAFWFRTTAHSLGARMWESPFIMRLYLNRLRGWLCSQ